jgi:hypothetical protein
VSVVCCRVEVCSECCVLSGTGLCYDSIPYLESPTKDVCMYVYLYVCVCVCGVCVCVCVCVTEFDEV